MAKSKQYINVDENVIDAAIKWIYGQQLENGCFDSHDTYNFLSFFNTKNSSLKEKAPSILTSYVLSSLLEASIEIPKPILDNAKRCIFGFNNNATDTYTTATGTYSLFLLGGSRNEAMRLLNNLIEQFPINNERKYCKRHCA